MSVDREIAELKREVKRLKSQLSRMAKPHQVQSQKFGLVERDPANMKAGEFEDKTVQAYKDETNSKRGLVFRIGGELFKLEGTAL